MKIRTSVELIDFLAQRKKERKRELISIAHDLSPRRRDPTGRVCREGVVFAYAHWEGFVKDAARAYVRLVTHKTHGLDSLVQCFQALASRQEFAAAQNATRRIQPHIAVVRRLIDDVAAAFRIDPDTAIDTDSNLTYEVFSNICESIGIDHTTEWATYGPFMNDLFLSRCDIAHGGLLRPDISYSKECVEFAIRSIEKFSTQIENAAVQDAHLR